MEFKGFDPGFLKFLEELADNNNKEWFQENKKRYQKEVQTPFLEFVAALAGPIKTVSPHLLADSRKTGGSMMRIYRDIRFSKDKTPYNTHISARFLHEAGKGVVAPGCFLRIRPEDVAVGAGIWQPDTPNLNRIRAKIDQEQDRWGSIRDSFELQNGCGLYDGEMLKRPPRGYSVDHPYVEDLKKKSFAVFTTWPAKTIQKNDFLGKVVFNYRECSPLMQFLAEAVGVPF